MTCLLAIDRHQGEAEVSAVKCDALGVDPDEDLGHLVDVRKSRIDQGNYSHHLLSRHGAGTDLLYVVERQGIIKVVDDGVVADDPFLDLTEQLLSSSIEKGLLGLAFHPEHESNGRFYAYWTEPAGDSVLAEFEIESPELADHDSLPVILGVDQPAERDNAGRPLAR